MPVMGGLWLKKFRRPEAKESILVDDFLEQELFQGDRSTLGKQEEYKGNQTLADRGL